MIEEHILYLRKLVEEIHDISFTEVDRYGCIYRTSTGEKLIQPEMQSDSSNHEWIKHIQSTRIAELNVF